MTGAAGIAWIGDGLIDSTDQIEPLVSFSQQHQAAIGREGFALEIDLDGLSLEAFQSRPFSFTPCDCQKPWVRGMGIVVTPIHTGLKAFAR